MPSPEARELALLLARKTEGDESILEGLLDDLDVPDEMLGFPRSAGSREAPEGGAGLPRGRLRPHAQHRLPHLCLGASWDRSSAVARADRGADALAVAARYDDRTEEVLDRDLARKLVSDVRRWSDRSLTKPE